MLPALEGEFKTFAAAAQDAAYSGLDQVGVEVYADLVRATGARVGRKQNGAAVWEAPAPEGA